MRFHVGKFAGEFFNLAQTAFANPNPIIAAGKKAAAEFGLKFMEQAPRSCISVKFVIVAFGIEVG